MKSDLTFKRFEKLMVEVEEKFSGAPWDQKDFYEKWLAQTYYYVCHSTRLLALCAARFKVDRDHLHIRFMQHMKEERQHEVLALRDLKGMGKSIEEVNETIEISSFYKSQYYWIEHEDPVAFFGYILCLEGLAVRQGEAAYRKALAAHGDKACSFLKVHTGEDPDHLQKAFSSLEDLSDEHMNLVFENMKEACAMYGNMLDRISNSSQSEVKKAG